MRSSSWFTFVAIMCFSLLGLSGFAYAQEITIPEVTNDQFIQLLLASLGGTKGASALAIVGIAVKLLIHFMGTPLAGKIFKKFSGAMKLLVVAALTVVSTIVTQMSLGVSFTAALLQGSTLTAILVLSNQIYKQFFEKSDPAVSVSNIPKG